jgi:hypothetical protein
MPKSSVSRLYIERRLKEQEHRLAHALSVVCEELDVIIGEQIASAADDDIRDAIIDEATEKRPHYFKQIIEIPPDELERAFGSTPTLAAQGKLIRKFGELSTAAAAKQWGTSLGSLKPGRDPDAAPGEAKRKKAADTDAPSVSSNPWHPDWKSSRPFKSPEEKRTLRLAAQSSVITAMGSAAAARMARSAGVTLGGQPLRK